MPKWTLRSLVWLWVVSAARIVTQSFQAQRMGKANLPVLMWRFSNLYTRKSAQSL